MFGPIIHCKREIKNLLLTNGRAGKAMHVGEKHHVAWHFPILNPLLNDFCMPVDCLNLPSVVHNSDSLEVTSVDNTYDIW